MVRKEKVIYGNIDDEVKEKLRKSDQKRKPLICENLDDESKDKL